MSETRKSDRKRECLDCGLPIVRLPATEDKAVTAGYAHSATLREICARSLHLGIDVSHKPRATGGLKRPRAMELTHSDF